MRAGGTEIVIVGGGPAGLSTALFLAHLRPDLIERMVVLERARFPRDKFCAGGVGARADHLLRRIGVEVDVPSVRVHGISLRLAGGEILERQSEIGRVVRRIEFDHALFAIAKNRGIRIREDAPVREVKRSADGWSVLLDGERLAATAVVGADGVGSVVRRSLGLPAGAYRAQVVEVDTEPVVADRPSDLLHFDASDPALSGYAWDFPTLVLGRRMVCRGVYQLKTGVPAQDIRGVLAQRLERLGQDLSRYRLKRYAERGFHRAEPMAQGRVLLVGEAAGIDPLSGEGIAQAIAYGAVAAEYLAERVEGDRDFNDWQSFVQRSPLGRDLWFRSFLTPYYFGRFRARMERFLLGTPQFMALGVQHFAGTKVGRGELLRVSLSAALHTLLPARLGAR